MVDHAVKLRGLQLPQMAGASEAPTVLSIMEQDFIPWFLRKLGSENTHGELGARDASFNEKDNQTRLYQPIHRSFNLVVVEAHCLVDGLPRLDPKKIISAGVTMRRKITQADTRKEADPVYKTFGAGTYGWMKENDKVLGWRPVSTTARNGGKYDPDPEFREKAAQGKNAAVLKHAHFLRPDDADYAEDFVTLYPASDEICEALGKTVLYGYLPVTSSEKSETDTDPSAPFDMDLVSARLPVILWSDERFDALDADDQPVLPAQDGTIITANLATPTAAQSTVIAGLSYLSQEAGLFLAEDEALAADDPAAEIRALLRQKSVYQYNEASNDYDFVNFYDYLVEANRALVERNPEIETHRLPWRWPDFTQEEEGALVTALHAAITARWVALSPGESRFQNADARYELQAFARIDRSDCGCPPETIWTEPSRRIEIVPWFEGGEAPPTIVELPSPSALKGKIKPNVAFKVPEEIQQFMSNLKLDKLMEGEQPDKKLEWGMICGFSIPIITICAFIVLQIFLSLFHILFWWLPFIRICIPFPKIR